jgi:predicted PurR-regulated permease PerM
MTFYEGHWPRRAPARLLALRRPLCILLSLLTLAGVLALVVGLVLPELVACVRLLAAELPGALAAGLAWVKNSGLLTSAAYAELFASLETINWAEAGQKFFRLLLEGVGGAAQAAVSTVSSVISVAATLLIGLIFAIYLLAGKEKLRNQFLRLFRRYLKPSWNSKLLYLLSTLDDCFRKFIVGQCTEAVILGALCMAGMAVFRFPYAVMVGTLVGFTALIPVAGAYIGAFVGAFMILTADPIKAAAFLVFIVVLQQLEGNLIYPKVVGSSIGLPGVWVLATVTVGGGLMGIPGMLLGVPLAAAVYRLISREVNTPPR